MNIKYQELKNVFWNVVLWSDVRRRYMWRIMIEIGEPYELYCIVYPVY